MVNLFVFAGWKNSFITAALNQICHFYLVLEWKNLTFFKKEKSYSKQNALLCLTKYKDLSNIALT